MQEQIEKEPLLGISLSEMVLLYLKISLAILVLVGTHQEVMTKGTFVNRQIRHYFGL